MQSILGYEVFCNGLQAGILYIIVLLASNTTVCSTNTPVCHSIVRCTRFIKLLTWPAIIPFHSLPFLPSSIPLLLFLWDALPPSRIPLHFLPPFPFHLSSLFSFFSLCSICLPFPFQPLHFPPFSFFVSSPCPRPLPFLFLTSIPLS